MHLSITDWALALVLEHRPALAVLLEAQLAFGEAALEHVDPVSRPRPAHGGPPRRPRTNSTMPVITSTQNSGTNTIHHPGPSPFQWATGITLPIAGAIVIKISIELSFQQLARAR